MNIVPIVHTVADFGNLADLADTVKRKIESGEKTISNSNAVKAFWDGLRSALDTWNVNFESWLIYQDALPFIEAEHSGIEQMIVSELAEKGSQNHQILKWLMEKGAKLIGTESPHLLVEEYQLMKESLETQSKQQVIDVLPQEILNRQAEILANRDRFIAKRIIETLDPGSTGIIFLGMAHSVEKNLATDIDVCYPFGRPKVARVP